MFFSGFSTGMTCVPEKFSTYIVFVTDPYMVIFQDGHQKACGRDIIWTAACIALQFDLVVLYKHFW